MRKVVIHNEPHAEDNAMLQALYSRSAESVTDHVEKLKEVGSGKFMSQYYLGYGHASIADCGFITIYIEGISMLCAKAIQDNPLYNGQESSSRYIDWSEQEFYNPYQPPCCFTTNFEKDFYKSLELLKQYRDFYTSQKPVVIEHLKTLYPRKPDEKETVYEKAITAKAFDILRGFLPCGATTNVSWTTSLRKANEHLAYLSLHPLDEVRDVAEQIHAQVLKAYPNSIAPLPDPSKVDPYITDISNYYSIDTNIRIGEGFSVDQHSNTYEVEFSDTNSFLKIDGNNSDNRPRKAGLHKHNLMYRERVQMYFALDFGSYRDLQRHRGGYCSFPLVEGGQHGFHKWYYDQLPEASKTEADKLFESIAEFLKLAGKDNVLTNQYLLPMGTLVQLVLDYDVHQMLYVAELRSSQTVHATLRPVAHQMGLYLEEELGIKTYCDYSADVWNTRRGNQDIVSKVV